MKRTLLRWISLFSLAVFLAACAGPDAGSAATASPAPVSTSAPTSPSAPASPSATPLPSTPTRAAAAPDAKPTATPGASVPPSAAKQALKFPDPALYTWQAVASGLQLPVGISDDGHGRLLVIQQHGTIAVVENGQVRAQLYLDLSDRVGAAGNEQGLLGLALSPNYTQNGYFYVNYTDLNGNTVIARFTADPSKAVAQASSQKILLRVGQPYPNHNGGSMVFGPDGYLYMGLGDGGSANDPQGNGQNLNTFLGKILRIDVSKGDPYAIPADNPFQSNAKPEIWAYGLRNPWRFSFDRATGDLYIADVGQDTWEEIDFQLAGSKGGANFGWNYREGAHPFRGEPPASLTLVDPVMEYKHPTGCSITGGFVYRGSALPDLQGIYFYGDYCTGKIYGMLRGADGTWQSQELFQTGTFISTFGEDNQGELYFASHRDGVILKLVKK